MASLYEGVVVCFDKNNKDIFDVDISHILGDCFEYFFHVQPLE